MDETTTTAVPVPEAPGEALTAVEAWLLELGLRVIEVEACPVDDCPTCGARRRRAA